MTIKCFNQWKEDYGLVHEPNYSLHTEINCLNAFKAGQRSKQQEIDRLKVILAEAVTLVKKDCIEYGISEELDKALQLLEGV